jgi:hypothetical protein
MTDKREVLIKYNIDQIFACREENNVMPPELKEYCNNFTKGQISILTDLVKPMDDVTKSHSHGINPNDIILRNVIRENLNKLNNRNYSDVLKDIKGLNYSNETHFTLLATELIIKSMSDVMGSKGLDASKPGQKTPSELYIDVALEMSQFFIEKDDKVIKFKTVLSRNCQQYFNDLTNKDESMDHHNPRRLSNYKGFMNMVGLMYSYGLFPVDIVILSFQKIIKLILKSDIPQEDCDNYYSGYERLMNRVLSHFEKTPVTSNMVDGFIVIKDNIKKLNDEITKSCEEPDKLKRPLRTFSIMTHQQNIARYTKLCELYKNMDKM